MAIVKLKLRYLAGVAVTLGLVALAAPSALAFPGPPSSSTFDPNTVSTQFVFDRTASQWAADFDRLTGQGFMVFDIEITQFGNQTPRYSAVFQQRPAGLGWRSLRDMSSSTFAAEYEQAVADGLRIADFEAYRSSSGAARFAAVWVSRGGVNSVLVRDRTSSQMQSVIATQRDQRRMPVDVEEYSIPGCEHCYATIWVDNNQNLGWQFWYGLSDSSFRAKFDQLEDSHRMVAVHGTIHIDSDFPDPDDVYNRYSGIWVTDPKHRGWAEHRNLDANELAQRRVEYAQTGYRPMAFESYYVEKTCTVLGGCVFTTNYAMIWRQNT
jgi:hypothetical protein